MEDKNKMKQNFIIENNNIIGVTGEKTIKDEYFNFGGYDLLVLVTKELDFYNIYVINYYFKQEPLNCLQLQEPKEYLKSLNKTEGEYFNNQYLEIKAIEFYLWFKYGNPDKDTVLSFNVVINN